MIVVATSAALTVTVEGNANGKTISLAPLPTAKVPGSIDKSETSAVTPVTPSKPEAAVERVVAQCSSIDSGTASANETGLPSAAEPKGMASATCSVISKSGNKVADGVAFTNLTALVIVPTAVP